METITKLVFPISNDVKNHQWRTGVVVLIYMVVAIMFSVSAPVLAQNTPQSAPVSQPRSQMDLRKFVPSTVSAGWRKVLEGMPDPTKAPPMPGPNDVEGWKKVFDANEQNALKLVGAAVKQMQVNVTSKTLGGVPVLEVTPKGWVKSKKLLIYTHGGAYTMFSARSSLFSAALAASSTGLRVISVDYTNPPRARWQKVTDQVVSVIKAFNKQGYAMKNLAIYGDSAGGGLAAGAVLKLRDKGLGMPAAVVLWSPWADITETGDTYMTLKAAEPNYIYDKVLGPSVPMSHPCTVISKKGFHLP